jgi:hypothetical protein
MRAGGFIGADPTSILKHLGKDPEANLSEELVLSLLRKGPFMFCDALEIGTCRRNSVVCLRLPTREGHRARHRSGRGVDGL